MKLVRYAALAAVLAGGVSTFALAQQVPPEKAFGARESVTSASLSPDGKTMAFLAPTTGKGNALFTVPVDGSTPPKRSMVASGEPEMIAGCGWVANDRLLCTVVAPREESGFILNASRLVAIDAAGTNFKMVSERNTDNALYFNRYGGGIVDWLPGQDGAFLMSKWVVPEVTTGTLIQKRKEGFTVERIDTRNMQSRTVVTGDGVDWFCLRCIRLPPPRSRCHTIVPLVRSTHQRWRLGFCPVWGSASATWRKMRPPQTIGVDPESAGISSFTSS